MVKRESDSVQEKPEKRNGKALALFGMFADISVEDPVNFKFKLEVVRESLQEINELLCE